jgi:cytochrome c oxidase subunit III
VTDFPSPVTHQYHDAEQRQQSNLLGMWTFLTTEVLFFGGLFAVYMVYRAIYPEGFAEASRHLDVLLGTVNTVLLLTSSLTVALAIHAAQTDRRTALVGFLIATMVLALIFLGLKAYEYYHEYEVGLIPGLNFTYTGPLAREVQLFFTIYFVMTGLHAIHMILGVGVIAVIAVRAWRRHFSPENYDAVEMTGLYWHFVDIVWVFLFPLLYLIERV